MRAGGYCHYPITGGATSRLCSAGAARYIAYTHLRSSGSAIWIAMRYTLTVWHSAQELERELGVHAITQDVRRR